MRKALFLLLIICFLPTFAPLAQVEKNDESSVTEEDLGKWQILDLGEPTPEEEAEAERSQQETKIEDSADASMEDMAEGTTEEQRDLGTEVDI